MQVIEFIISILGFAFTISVVSFTYFTLKNIRFMRTSFGHKFVVGSAVLSLMTSIVGTLYHFNFPSLKIIAFSIWIFSLLLLIIGCTIRGMQLKRHFQLSLYRTFIQIPQGKLYMAAISVLLFVSLPSYIFALLTLSLSDYNWSSITQLGSWAIAYLILMFAEKNLYYTFHRKNETMKYRRDNDITWLEEEVLVCGSYGDLTNYCILAAIPYVGKKSLKNVLINYFENTPVLFEGCKIRKNGSIELKGIVKNLENIYSKGRVTTICMLFGELNRKLMDILRDATSPEYAKEIYEKGFRDAWKRYKNKPIFLKILRSLPDDILETERFGLLSKDELEVKVRERTKKLEKIKIELERANKELKGLDKMKSDFIDIASHELRTPMTPIKSLVQLIEEGGLERMDKTRRETLFRTLNSSIERLTSTVTEMLDISRLEKVELQLEPLSMHLIAEKAINGLAARIEEKKHNVVLDIPKEVPRVQGDRILISNLVINLLSNAVRYTPDGGTITIRSHREGKNLHSTVSDTGIGIPKEDLTEIFRPFYQVEDVEHRKSGGVGLGLNIVRGITDRHGGRVWATSELGKGSTFHFILPLKGVKKKKEEV